MGMLDDAIREHLELKRLRGADPGEVAREQREALDPTPRSQSDEATDDSTAAPPVALPAAEKAAPADIDASDNEPTGTARVARRGNVANASQETAELDMQSVLNDDVQAPDDVALSPDDASRVDSVAVDPVGRTASDERPAEPTAEQDEGSSDATLAVAGAVVGEHALEQDDPSDTAWRREDVEAPAWEQLGQAPQVLSETPEQERLWSERHAHEDLGFES